MRIKEEQDDQREKSKNLKSNITKFQKKKITPIFVLFGNYMDDIIHRYVVLSECFMKCIKREQKGKNNNKVVDELL